MFNSLFWQDHYAEPNNTFALQTNEDGTVTLSRAGEVKQQGTPMNAANFNRMESGIFDSNLANRLLSIAMNSRTSSSHVHSADDITDGTFPIERGGTGVSTLEALKTLLGLDVKFATTSLFSVAASPSSFLSDAANGGYYQTISVAGLLDSDTPIADVVLGEDIDANALYLDAWSCITRITTAENAVTLWANDSAPLTAFTIQLQVVR